MRQTQSKGDNLPSGLVPNSARDIWQTLENLAQETSEERIAFAMAGALFLAGSKAGFYNRSTSGIDRTILFFKFVECVDSRLRFEKTFTNLSGRFVNYLDSKLVNPKTGDPNQSAREPIRMLIEKLSAIGAEDEATKSRVVRSMLRVRDAAYLFVAFSYDWSQRLKDVEDILGEKFGAAFAVGISDGGQ